MGPDQHWATDLCRVRDGLVVVDLAPSEIEEWRADAKATKAARKVRPELVGPIKQVIEEEPSFGYRTVAALLGHEQEHGVQRTSSWVGSSQAGHRRHHILCYVQQADHPSRLSVIN